MTLQWPRRRWMDGSLVRSFALPNVTSLPLFPCRTTEGLPAHTRSAWVASVRACVGGPKRIRRRRRMQRKEAREDGESHDGRTGGRGRRLNGRETDSIADSLEVILDTARGAVLFDLSFSYISCLSLCHPKT